MYELRLVSSFYIYNSHSRRYETIYPTTMIYVTDNIGYFTREGTLPIHNEQCIRLFMLQVKTAQSDIMMCPEQALKYALNSDSNGISGDRKYFWEVKQV